MRISSGHQTVGKCPEPNTLSSSSTHATATALLGTTTKRNNKLYKRGGKPWYVTVPVHIVFFCSHRKILCLLQRNSNNGA